VCSPGGGRSYTDTDKERLYIKVTIQKKVYTINNVHTVQIQTYKLTQGHVILFVGVIFNSKLNKSGEVQVTISYSVFRRWRNIS
jgi:hypothetical protein